MRRINGLILSTVTAAILVGCGGGGGSSSSSGTTTPTVTTTDVTVERGAVYGATVTDANGQVATQKTGTNVYTFATTPVYPITASGGIIDIDNNGVDEGDIELTTTLTSYSTVVTPITTYLGDVKTDSGKAKLAKLKEISGITNENDLITKVASELSTEVLVLTNTLFDIMNDDDTTNDDFISDYDNSEFKTKFDELKTEADKYTDKKEIAKSLEEKVVTNLGLTKLTTEDLANTTTTATLKVADLKRYVNYEADDSEWYGDNILADGKITFKDYDYEYNSETKEYEWILDANSDSVIYTPDATNPYRFSYVDPISKEEGTFTILSTKKVANYSDLYKSEAKIVVTKKATELKWDRWNWENPTYWDNSTQKYLPVTDITSLVKMFTVDNNWLGLDDMHVLLTSDGTVVKGVFQYGYYVRGTTKVGTWKQEGEFVVATIGTEIRYFKVVLENGVYYVAEAGISEVGDIMSEVMYTGTSLDEFVTKIKAQALDNATPSPVFTSSPDVRVDEKQTSAFTAVAKAGRSDLTITYSLSGTDASYFNIDSTTGVVTFKVAPDFETKELHFFNIDVIATDSLGKKSTQNVYININNLDEVVTPTTPISDLIGSYKFENNTSDESSYTNNLTIYSLSYPVSSTTPAFIDGKYAKSLDLQNSKFNSTNLQNNFSKGITVSLWVKTNELKSGKVLAIKEQSTVSSNTSKLGIDLYYPSHSGWKFALSISDSSGSHYEVYPSNEAEITTNTWYHIVYTVDPTGKVRVWYNGVEGIGAQINNPEFLTWDLSNYKLQVGSVGEGADFSGSVDNLIIYKNVLSDDEIKLIQ